MAKKSVSAPTDTATKPAAKSTKVKAVKTEPNKTMVAQKLFDANYGKKTPAQIKAMFIEKAGLTHNGAQSYYGRMKVVADKAKSAS